MVVIEDDFLTLGSLNRPGTNLIDIMGLVIHYVGVPQRSAKVIRDNFERGEIYGSTQYICDYDTGHFIRTMPENELAYHVGASVYKPLKFELVGDENPNYYFVGIETCIDSVEFSKPSDVQWDALTQFSAEFIERYNLTVNNIYLHNEITYTECYKWFIDNPDDWQRFKNDVQSILDSRK